MAYPLTLRYASTIGSIGLIMASGFSCQPENMVSHMSTRRKMACTVGVDKLRIKKQQNPMPHFQIELIQHNLLMPAYL